MPESRRYRLEKCVFEATLACNLSCKHCGSMAGRPRPDELSLGEATAVFRDLAALGCSKLVLMGGEVMLRDDWAGLVEAGAAQGMMVGLLSNGLLVNRRSAGLAKDAGLHALGLSLDGIGAVHDEIRGRKGVFESVLRAVEAADAVGLPFSFVTQVNRANLHQLEEIHGFVEDTGSYAWQVQIGETVGNMLDHPELHLTRPQILDLTRRLAGIITSTDLHIVVGDSIGYFGPHEKELRANQSVDCFSGCQAGRSVVGLESNGNVKGCLSISPGYSGDAGDYVEGNVREESIIEMWHRDDAFAYNRVWSVDQLAGFCRTCAHAKRCRGGCRSHMVASGDGEQNPLCVHRILSEEGAPPAIATRSLAGARAAVAALALGLAGCDGSKADVPADSGMDAGNDTDADTDTSTETDTDTETGFDGGPDTDYGDGGIVLYMFCMDVGKGRTGVPVSHKCGGSTCAKSLIAARRRLSSEKPSWKREKS